MWHNCQRHDHRPSKPIGISAAQQGTPHHPLNDLQITCGSIGEQCRLGLGADRNGADSNGAAHRPLGGCYPRNITARETRIEREAGEEARLRESVPAQKICSASTIGHQRLRRAQNAPLRFRPITGEPASERPREDRYANDESQCGTNSDKGAETTTRPRTEKVEIHTPSRMIAFAPRSTHIPSLAFSKRRWFSNTPPVRLKFQVDCFIRWPEIESAEAKDEGMGEKASRKVERPSISKCEA